MSPSVFQLAGPQSKRRMASPSVLQLAGAQSEKRMVSPSVSQPAGSQSKERLVNPSVLQLAGSQSKARTRRPPTVDPPVARARRHRVVRRCVADRALGCGQDRLWTRSAPRAAAAMPSASPARARRNGPRRARSRGAHTEDLKRRQGSNPTSRISISLINPDFVLALGLLYYPCIRESANTAANTPPRIRLLTVLAPVLVMRSYSS